MQLYNNTIDSFGSVNYIISSLNRAINTTYIPSGETIQEVISNFTKIQLQRSFNPGCGWGQADLEMRFNERHLLVSYSSTSATSVNIWYYFNDNMEVEKIEVSVWLPDDRAQSGRCHYECLTQELYTHKFLKVDWQNEKAEIELPYDLVKLNDKEDWDLSTNIPNWVYEQQSNFIAHWNPDKVVSELLELGYIPVNNVIGYKAIYCNPSHYIQYVVVYEKLHQVDNNYYCLYDSDTKLEVNNGLSYKSLIEFLTETKDKEQRQSRRSRRNRTTVIKQDNDLEDYEYDENDIEVDYDYDEE